MTYIPKVNEYHSLLVIAIASLCSACSASTTIEADDRGTALEAPVGVSSPSRPRKNAEPVGIGFTIDKFLANAPGLKPLESLGEFKNSQKFSMDFVDGTGVVTGEYLKGSRTVEHLAIAGTGPKWDKIVEICVFLATRDIKKSLHLQQQLCGTSLEATEKVGAIDFRLSDLMGQKLLVIQNERDPIQSPAELADNYITPSVGKSLTEFKQRFNSSISELDSKLVLVGDGEEMASPSPSYLEYRLGSETVIHLYGNQDSLALETVMLDSVPAEATNFWHGARATVDALNPAQTESQRAEIMQRLGFSKLASLPTQSTTFERGDLSYDVTVRVSPMKFAALTIQSNKP